jgi:hypothetical protein
MQYIRNVNLRKVMNIRQSEFNARRNKVKDAGTRRSLNHTPGKQSVSY